MSALEPSEFELRLADEELHSLLSGVPEFAHPAHVELDVETEREGDDTDAVSASTSGRICSINPVALSVLRYLRERDRDLAISGNTVVPAYQLFDFSSLEQDGRVDRVVAAAIGEPSDGGFLIPLRAPLDVRWVGLLSGLGVSDRVRLLTEIIRVLGNLVRFGGLSDGLRRELVRGLRQPVRLLCTLVRDGGQDPADKSHDASTADPYPCGSNLSHSASVEEGSA